MEIFLRLEFALGPRWVNRTTTWNAIVIAVVRNVTRLEFNRVTHFRTLDLATVSFRWQLVLRLHHVLVRHSRCWQAPVYAFLALFARLRGLFKVINVFLLFWFWKGQWLVVTVFAFMLILEVCVRSGGDLTASKARDVFLGLWILWVRRQHFYLGEEHFSGHFDVLVVFYILRWAVYVRGMALLILLMTRNCHWVQYTADKTMRLIAFMKKLGSGALARLVELRWGREWLTVRRKVLRLDSWPKIRLSVLFLRSAQFIDRGLLMARLAPARRRMNLALF